MYTTQVPAAELEEWAGAMQGPDYLYTFRQLLSTPALATLAHSEGQACGPGGIGVC